MVRQVLNHTAGIYGCTTHVFGNRSGIRQLALSITPLAPTGAAALTQAINSLPAGGFCAG